MGQRRFEQAGNNRGGEAKPATAAQEREPEKMPDGLHVVEIIDTVHTAIEGPRGRKVQQVLVLLSRTEGDQEYLAHREYTLDRASEVAELRKFLAFFDFPLNSEEDLREGCHRAKHGTMWVCVSTERNGERLVRFLDRFPTQAEKPQWKDKTDIWNHRLHWKLHHNVYFW